MHTEVKYPYQKLPYYPHAKPNEMIIWERFIDQHPDFFDSVMYDVYVGEDPERMEDCPDNVHGAWCDLTKWRIDAVAEDKDKIYVIEIKERAGARAIGQALSYHILFQEHFKPTKPVIPVIVTDEIQANTEKAAKAHGVVVLQA